MRLIDADALIAEYDKVHVGPAGGARKLMEDAPTIKPESNCSEFPNNWIPVDERLPDEDKEVLVTVYFHGLKQTHQTGWNDHIRPSYYVETASQIGGNWSSVSDEYKVARNRHEVIAWMPLPEPWKGE